jgi:metal-responsive CopG/Arc/MetJ family transcriptional regulator
MKTAISVPDAVFKAADRLARRRGISRSELYTRALQTLLRADGDDQITAKLNEVYAHDGSALPAELRGLPTRVLDREEW